MGHWNVFEHAFAMGWTRDYPSPQMMGVDPAKPPGFNLPLENRKVPKLSIASPSRESCMISLEMKDIRSIRLAQFVVGSDLSLVFGCSCFSPVALLQVTDSPFGSGAAVPAGVSGHAVF